MTSALQGVLEACGAPPRATPPWVRNGTHGSVVDLGGHAERLDLFIDHGEIVRIPGDYLAHARHGYALTGVAGSAGGLAAGPAAQAASRGRRRATHPTPASVP